MNEPESKQLDQRLLIAGYVIAAIGYAVLLIGVLRPGLAWLVASDRVDVVVPLVWVLSFAMLGVAFVNSGNRLRRAYRAGMQLGF